MTIISVLNQQMYNVMLRRSMGIKYREKRVNAVTRRASSACISAIILTSSIAKWLVVALAFAFYALYILS
jgi:predicted Co/Zn/Cd cation transporter (cation efflux family)